MARVGDRTRNTGTNFVHDPKVKHTTLEFNSGGHFADAQEISESCQMVIRMYSKRGFNEQQNHKLL